MINVECPSCSAPYELDERRLPSSGLKMRCPKCGATFRVHRSGETDMGGDAPAAGAKKTPRTNTIVGVGGGGPAAPPPPPVLPDLDGGIDLPTPKHAPPPPPFSGQGGAAAGHADLPVAKKAPVAPSFPGPGGGGPGHADLPVAKKAPVAPPFPGPGGGHADLPTPKKMPGPPQFSGPGAPEPKGPVPGLDFELDLPAPKPPVAPPFPGPSAMARAPQPPGGLDLPAPKGKPRPPSGLDLPAPKGKPRPPSGVDLPAPKGRPRPPSGVDLPAPKGGPSSAFGALDLDLPAPKAAASSAGGFGGLDDLDLPMPKADVDLPAVKGGGGFGDIDLPTPKTSPQGGGGMEDFGELDLPMAKGGVDLPVRQVPGGMPQTPGGGGGGSFDDLDLPMRKGDGDLPTPRATAGQAAEAFADLELPMPSGSPPAPSASSPLTGGQPMGDPDLELPVPRDDLELPPPVARRGGLDGPALPTPSFPPDGQGAPSGGAGVERGQAGGMGFGELDLGGADAGDDMEFADLPEERDSFSGRGPVAVPGQSIGVADEAAAETRERRRGKAAVEEGGKQRKPRLLIAVGVLGVIIVGTGIGLGFTPHGYFGMYALEQFLPEAGSAAAATQVIDEAETLAANDTYEDVRASLTKLAEGRRQMGLNRRLLARSLLHESLYAVRFGEDNASGSRAIQILQRLNTRGGDAPGMDLARAAEALARGETGETHGHLAGARAEAPDDPYLHLIEGELGLVDGDPAAAAQAFEQALAAGGGARAQWGIARARLASEAPGSAAESIDATLEASPRHAGALAARARILLREGEVVEALQLAKAAAGSRELDGHLIRPSAAERAVAWTLVGQAQERRGQRTRAREAYEAALQADAYDVEALLGRGRVLLLDERHRDALTSFEAVISAGDAAAAVATEDGHTVLSEAQLGAARAMLRLDRIQDAKSLLDALLVGHAEDAVVVLWLGKAEQALDDRAGAEQHYRDAIQFAPQSFDGYLALAQFFFSLDRPSDAASVLEQARSQVDETAYVRRMLGQLELERNDAPAAIREFTRALELDDHDLFARFGLGQALRRSGRLEEAGETLGLVAEADSSWPGLALERGLVYEARGESNEAVESYRLALEERPNDPDLLLRLGAAYVSANRVDEAEDTLARVIEERPNSAEAEHFIGRVEFARGNLPAALTHFSRAVSLDAGRGEFQLYVGWVSLEMSNLARALEAVEAALQRDPSLGDAYWIRGRIRVRTGAVRDALEDLERALQLKPGRYEAYAAMAEAYDQLRRMSDAIQAWRRALERDNSNGEWWYRLGRLQMDNGQRREASESLSRATVIGDATDPRPGWLADAHRVLGDAQRLGGQRQDAIQHYRRYLELAPPTAIDRNEVRDQLLALGVAP